MRPALPSLMSVNGGYVDTATFLALQGLFVAHVTGNFVTLGASLALGTSGAIAKLLALPVFCASVVATRFLGDLLSGIGLLELRSLLLIKFILLCAGGVLAAWLGPFSNGDALSAITTGMVFVTAMGIQNAIHRIYLPKAPPTTLMTGTTTQLMIDIADTLRGGAAAKEAIRPRLSRLASAVVAFALGCTFAAVLFAFVGRWCFVIPPLVACLEIFSAEAEPVTK